MACLKFKMTLQVTTLLFHVAFGVQVPNNERLIAINIVEKYGYPIETHEIETEDGYLLDVYRIPYGQNSVSTKPNKYPVLLTHGLFGSAENFLVGGPKKALSYLLADNGYDVWLLNCRGSWHSRKHRTLDPDKDKEFWRFTFHEIGFYDLPASIDYILSNTDSKKLQYVGHSQGTTSYFIMASTRPQYNNKINLMIALAPSMYLTHIKDRLLRILASMHKLFERFSEILKINELFPPHILSNSAVRSGISRLCNIKARAGICLELLSLGVPFESQIDRENLSFITSTAPAGSSAKQPLHYAQIITSGKFQNYDWGIKENIVRYNSTVPPEYNIKNSVAPIALMYGESDSIVSPQDVLIVSKELPNVVELYKVPYKYWTHLDFIFAKDIVTYLNNHILELLDKYRNKE